MEFWQYNPQSRVFSFDSYFFDLQRFEAHFHYSFQDLKTWEKQEFEEVLNFDDANFDIRSDFKVEVLENILFHIHMALWISYYKAYPTEKLLVSSAKIDDYQKEFWKKFYINGLWEFLFTNNISPKNLFQFENNSENELSKVDFTISNKALVPIGWGKDSIVSLELLAESWIEYDTFVFWKMDIIKEKCTETIGKPNLLVTRQISHKLFELNRSGYFNGHVPITGIIAFSMELVAYLFDYKYLVLSNEKSANFWNTLWEWVEINHQWSKSLEFEQDFWEYVEKYISSETKYFSLLRGMYELKIAELFVNYWKKYFNNFSSCNKNFAITKDKNHDGLWCNSCPKCAFVFSMLRPFLNKSEVQKIFAKDLFFDQNLEKLFRELLWISWIKPFECVWTNEEVIYSMYLVIQKDMYWENLPNILKIFKEEVLSKMNEEELEKIKNKLFKITTEDIIPAELKKSIKIFD